MRAFTSASMLIATAVRVAAQTTGELGDAIIVENPLGAVYRATFGANPLFSADTPTGGPVQGDVVATTPPSGVGVMYTVRFQNLPTEGGPFSYHLHVDPVPEDGNCTKTLAHLDPFVRGEITPCDPAAPATCQVGDLSGKYGKIESTGENFQSTYTDEFTALYEGPGAFFGNRSIVLHFANKTRIACANFVIESAGVIVNSENDGDSEHGDDEDCTTSTETPPRTATSTLSTVDTPFSNGTTTATSSGAAAATGGSEPDTTSRTDEAQATESSPVFGAASSAVGSAPIALLSFAALFMLL